MKFDLYFHNDFDGRASAAVFLDFLKSRGDGIANFYRVDHWIGQNWDGLVRASKNPVAIFDFYFHPKAEFFFDHHATTFVKKGWDKIFRATKFHHLRPEYKSCCRLVAEALKKNFGYRAPAHIKELMSWLDVVDGAMYSSARQTIELAEPALQIDSYIDSKSRSHTLSWLVKRLSEEFLDEVARDPRIQSTLKRVRARIKEGLDFARKNLQIYDKVVFLDLSRSVVSRVRFAPHYLYPDLSYVVTLMKDGRGYRIAIGGNPWKKNSCKVDLGGYVRKFYGGGGHKRAAGIAGIKTRETGLRIVEELIEFLGKK